MCSVFALRAAALAGSIAAVIVMLAANTAFGQITPPPSDEPFSGPPLEGPLGAKGYIIVPGYKTIFDMGATSTACNDWETINVFSSGTPDPKTGNPKACHSTGFHSSAGLGYDWALGSRWLAGVVASIGFSTNNTTASGVPGASTSANDSVNVKEDWGGTVRGRLGYAVAARTLVYGTAGFAWQHIRATVTCNDPSPCGRGAPGALAKFSATNSTTMPGWTVGGGVEYALMKNIAVRAEYRYADFGTYTATYGNPANAAVTSDIRLRTHTAIIGLSFALSGVPAPAARTALMTQ